MRDRRRVFFVHLMKTGGRGISDLLGQAVGREAVYPPDTGPQVFRKLSPALLDEAAEAGLDRFRCITVHMPAWVIDVHGQDRITATVVREPVARTWSHLRHIARLLDDGSRPEQLWHRPEWRSRLVDHQVRMLGAQPDPGPILPDWVDQVDEASDEDRAALAASLEVFLATAGADASPLGPDHLARARDRLASLDVVGRTERLDDFVARLREASGLPLGQVTVRNAAGSAEGPPESLAASIREATALDRELYDWVTATIGRPAPARAGPVRGRPGR